MSNTILKEIFEVESKHGAFYTGGNIKWSKDGQYIFCQKNGTVSILSIKKGIILYCLGERNNNEEEDIINTFTLSDNDVNVITHHKSGLFKLWNWKDNKLIKLWKSIHKGPVACIAHLTERNLMASGGSDGAIRLWNLQHYTCIHNLRGARGVISALVFCPNNGKELVFAAGDDVKIHGWNIKSGKEEVTFSGHFSKITSLSFLKDANYLVSSGRDKVLILWDISSGLSIRILPVYEEIEDIFIIPKNVSSVVLYNRDENGLYVAGAGEKATAEILENVTWKKYRSDWSKYHGCTSTHVFRTVAHYWSKRLYVLIELPI